VPVKTLIGQIIVGRGRLWTIGVVMLMLTASGAAAWHWTRTSHSRMDWISASVDGLPYRVLLPAGYDSNRSYPAILYLHQYLMGNDPDVLLQEVEGWFAAAWFREKFPAIVVVPVLDQRGNTGANFGGKRVGPVMENAAVAAVQQAVTQYHADPARVYVTGNSMGGMGAWDMLLHHNALNGDQGRVFAAGLVLAGKLGTADPEQAAQVLRGVPIWVIHGGRDHEVSGDWDRSMARLLGGTPAFRYTEDPALGHDVWHTYYGRADVWAWLFGQRAPQT
jgi:predicted peptidase